MKFFTQPFWKLLCTTILIAMGINIVWGMLLTMLWSASPLNPLKQTVKYEDLHIDCQGVPYVGWYSYPSARYRYRRLDGTEIDPPEENLGSASLINLHNPVNWLSASTDWRDLLLNQEVTDGKQYPGSASWFVVRDVQARSYLEGFDDAAKLPIGFISRKGFTRTVPPAEQCFQLQGLTYHDFASPGHNQQSGWIGKRDKFDLLPWGVYLRDEGKLVEVDLRRRTVRTVLESIPPVCLGTINVITPSESPEDKTKSSRNKDQPDFTQQLALRTSDQLSLFDVNTGKQQAFVIPKQLQTENTLTIWATDKQELFVADANSVSSAARRLMLYRINPAGEILQTIPVDLDGYVYQSERANAWQAAPVGPVPLLWSAALAIGSVTKVQDGHDPTYSVALQNFFRTIWAPFVIVLFLSLLAAFWVYRSERHHYGAHPLAWSITTFLLGPAMLVAYLIERGRPVTTTCGACHAQVPAKRDACAKCGAEFPAPKRTGCEIFAA